MGLKGGKKTGEMRGKEHYRKGQIEKNLHTGVKRWGKLPKKPEECKGKGQVRMPVPV